MLQKQISNQFLNETKIIKAKTQYELEQKIQNQKKRWKTQEKKLKEQQIILKMKENAIFETNKALSEVEKFRSLLIFSMSKDHVIDWNDLFDLTTFTEDEPSLETFIKYVDVPKEDKFLEFFFWFLEDKRLKKQKEAEKLYHEAVIDFNNRKNIFLNEQKEKNKLIESFKKDFEECQVEAVESYFGLVFDNSTYPKDIPKQFEFQYIQVNKTLIIDFQLPHPNNVPKTIEYKFVQTRKETTPKTMKKSEFESYYDDILYQITLRSIYECFNSDYKNSIEAIVFNGWIKGIDTATGKDFNSCIVSLHTDRETFLQLNLEKVVPKDCFRNLKGLSAGPLHQIAPVRPLLELNRNDKRFIESKEILAEINSIPNLAVMDWNDFEHLVRELFELYFKKLGGEVRVTQASREGGIDAVAFDPDPIRGGKFIIQAKRYNDIVPPSAVRELNGVMTDEGASRGILVTTAYYGKDSHDFVKNKPITLIDGPRLVYMFKEHGHQVRCEINKNKKRA